MQYLTGIFFNSKMTVDFPQNEIKLISNVTDEKIVQIFSNYLLENHIPTALKENIRYCFEKKNKVAVCPVQQELNPVKLLEELKGRCPEEVKESGEWLAVPSPVLCPESSRVLREVDGILLAVKAGRHAGKQMEYTMEHLEQQDCKVTAAILCDADEWLIRHYYCFRKEKET